MEEKVLRRSPRLSSSVVGTESSCSKSKPTLQNHSSQLRASVELGAKPLLSWHGDDCCGLSDSLDEQPFKRVKTFSENSDLEMLEDDLLSPRITNSDFGVEKGKTKSSLIELPKSDGKHPPENKLGKLRSLEKIKHLCSEKKQNIICSLIGDPVPNDEAQKRWRWRYEMKSQRSNSRRLILDDDDEDKIVWNVECHYTQAKIGGSIFDLGDCAYIKELTSGRMIDSGILQDGLYLLNDHVG